MAAAALGGALMLASAWPSDLFAPVPASTPQKVPAPPAAIPSPSAQLAKPAAPEFFVMIDPAHGGDDSGAILPGDGEEKDIALSWARDLKRRLEERGIPARLLRDSDQTVSLDRRAELANEARPAFYIALHLAPLGTAVDVYSPAIPFSSQPVAGKFIPWDSAQSAWLGRSRVLARAVTSELRKQDRRVTALAAPLRPLNNLVMPAIAMEFSPLSHPSENQKLQRDMAGAIAAGVARVRGPAGDRP